MDRKLFEELNRSEESGSGFQASCSGYNDHEIKVKLENVHHSIAIKEDSDLEYHQDSNEVPLAFCDNMDTCNWLEYDSEDENQLSLCNDDDSEYSDQEPTNNDDENSDTDVSDVENCAITSNINNTNSGRQDYYLSKNKLINWSKNPPGPSIIKKENICIRLPEVKGSAKNCKSPLECWEYYFPLNIINNIVRFTNSKLLKIKSPHTGRRECYPTDADEIKALLGLLYLAGVHKMSRVNAIDLWSTDGIAPELFRCVMSYTRFSLLLRALRFDDISTRKNRVKTDKLAPIREIWDHFNFKCQDAYVPGEYCTVDEMMSECRGRCSFKQYIPSQPNRCGLKTFTLSDARTFYIVNLEMDIGSQPANIVKRIAQPILNTGRNISMDNRFTSIPLIKELLQDYNTTVVGTLRKNKPDVPSEFSNPTRRAVNSSMFGFYNDLSLVSYVPKENKCFLIVSSMHQTTEIDIETCGGKIPEIVTFYNKAKGGIGMADRLKAAYTVARCSCRWPLTAFFTLLDVAGINSSIIHYANICDQKPERINRSSFLKDFAKELIQPHLRKRLAKRKLSFELRSSIEKLLSGGNANKRRGNDSGDDDSYQVKRGLCYLCPPKKNRKSKSKCIQCSRFICTSHTIKTCVKCQDAVMLSDED